MKLKIKFWINSKTQIVKKKLKKSNDDKTQNSNCDKTQKTKLWWNSITHIVMKLNNSNCDETQKLKLWQNSKLKLWRKNLNYEEKKVHLWKEEKTSNIFLVNTFWHLDKWWDVLRAVVCNFCIVYKFMPPFGVLKSLNLCCARKSTSKIWVRDNLS